MRYFAGICFLIAFAFCKPAMGQADSASIIKADSLKDAALQSNANYLQQLDAAHRNDSVKKAALEQEIAALKTTDNLKKADLEKQLEQLNSAATLRLQKKQAHIDSLKKYVKGFPVVYFNDTLFYIYTRLGPFSPHARAMAIENKIDRIESDVFYKEDSLKIIPAEESTDLMYGDMIVLSITENDALWMSMSQQELTQHYREQIINAIKEYRKATSVQTRLKQAGMSLLVIVFAGIVIFLINRLYRKIKYYIVVRNIRYIKGVKVRSYELFSISAEKRIIVGVLNLLRWAVILILLYLTLPVLFSFFPWTKHFATTLIGYIMHPVKRILHGIWGYLPNLVTIIIIFIVFYYINKAIRFFKEEIESGVLKIPGFYADWANPTYQLIRVLLSAFLLVVIFPYLPGSDSPIFKGVSVFLGVLFTFGSSGSLSNLIAGFVLTYMRAYKIGDRVTIGGITGDIVEKNLLVTRVRTIKNEDITIPNATIMNSHTINYSASSQDLGLILHTTVTIGYDVPWRQIHELLISAARATPDILQDPAPFVLQTSLDDFYVSYQVNAYTHKANGQSGIYSLLHQNIQDKFFEAGVEIMSPHFAAVRDGNTAAIPPDHLPPDYVAPSFRVEQKEKK